MVSSHSNISCPIYQTSTSTEAGLNHILLNVQDKNLPQTNVANFPLMGFTYVDIEEMIPVQLTGGRYISTNRNLT